MKKSYLDIDVLREIARDPSVSQRQIASNNGISLGKVNYVIKALLNKGHIKLHNFQKAGNKRKYMYLLTPEGMGEKTRLTKEFLKRKMEEYDHLQRQIVELEEEVNNGN